MIFQKTEENDLQNISKKGAGIFTFNLGKPFSKVKDRKKLLSSRS